MIWFYLALCIYYEIENLYFCSSSSHILILSQIFHIYNLEVLAVCRLFFNLLSKYKGHKSRPPLHWMPALREHFYNPKNKKINSFVVFEIAIPIIVVIVLFFNTEFSPLFSAVVVYWSYPRYICYPHGKLTVTQVLQDQMLFSFSCSLPQGDLFPRYSVFDLLYGLFSLSDLHSAHCLASTFRTSDRMRWHLWDPTWLKWIYNLPPKRIQVLFLSH